MRNRFIQYFENSDPFILAKILVAKMTEGALGQNIFFNFIISRMLKSIEPTIAAVAIMLLNEYHA